MSVDKSPIRCVEHKEVEPIKVLYPPQHYQYAAWRCGDAKCNKWLTHCKWPRTSAKLRERQREIRNLIYSAPQCTNEQLHDLLMFYQLVDPSIGQIIEYQALVSALIRSLIEPKKESDSSEYEDDSD
jgi:hypothetical protein